MQTMKTAPTIDGANDRAHHDGLTDGELGAMAPNHCPMSAEYARAVVDAIHDRMGDIRELILELHNRKGWAALGYKSWEACVTAEFSHSRGYLYRQLQAALIERELAPAAGHINDHLSPMGDKQTLMRSIPERQLRPLAKLDTPEQRREAWEEAKAAAPEGNVTVSHVEWAVERRLPPKPEPNESKPVNKTRVNGVLTDDPPDIAALRASGKIAPEVVPVISEADSADAPEPEPSPGPSEEELDDDAWLATLPLREKLSGAASKWFDIDALLFRAVTPARKTFHHTTIRALNVAERRGGRNGAYAYRLSQFLRIEHPRDWKLCPPTEHGGCGGSGTLGLLGQCTKCRGRGYWIF